MARSISDEELQLRKRARRRLIGAIVLVTAVAVVLPMVLDTEPKPVDQDISIKIPSPDSGAFKSKVIPSSPTGPVIPETPQTTAKTAPDAAATGELPAPSKKQAAPNATKPSPEARRSKDANPPAAKSGKEQFVVQVVALADVEKALRVKRKISGAGVKAYTEVVKTAKGDVTRVRAGPFATREAAEKARERLKGIGFDGRVIPVK